MHTGTLKERKRREQEQETKILHALSCRKKQLAETKRDKKQKKKPVDALLPLLSVKNIRYDALRYAEEYVPRSYNLDKQLLGLINHLFVTYPVPYFLYQACLADTPKSRSEDKFADLQNVYRKWFITLAQGGSFPKLVKGVMTSREAAAFLERRGTGESMRMSGGPR